MHSRQYISLQESPAHYEYISTETHTLQTVTQEEQEHILYQLEERLIKHPRMLLVQP